MRSDLSRTRRTCHAPDFDRLEAEEAWQEHLNGRRPGDLGRFGPELVAGEPEIRPVDIVAAL